MDRGGTDTEVSSAPSTPSAAEAVMTSLLAANRQRLGPPDDVGAPPEARIDVLCPYVEEERLPYLAWMLFGLPKSQPDGAPNWQVPSHALTFGPSVPSRRCTTRASRSTLAKTRKWSAVSPRLIQILLPLMT